jgi:hypothetical protein
VENSADLVLLFQDRLPLVTLSYFLLCVSVTFRAQSIFSYYTSGDMKFLHKVEIPLRRPSPMGFLMLHVLSYYEVPAAPTISSSSPCSGKLFSF